MACTHAVCVCTCARYSPRVRNELWARKEDMWLTSLLSAATPSGPMFSLVRMVTALLQCFITPVRRRDKGEGFDRRGRE